MNISKSISNLDMFYIEGNIGAGKSTFITLFEKYLKKDEESHLLQEPVESWLNTKDSSGKHILQHYYEDQKKYGFTFQMNAFISRVNDIEEMKKLNKNAFIKSVKSKKGTD